MQEVLVTGGAGFIGSYVVEQLIDSGRFVYVLDNFRTGQEENLQRLALGRYELIRDSVVNIGLHPQLRRAGTIYHLAAEVGNINSIERPFDDAATNVLGTIRVCDFAREIAAKLIYSSSCAIYGEPAYLPIDEKHPTQPASPYGLSKLTGELYVRLYGQLHRLPYVCLRYFNVYGEGQLFNPYANVIPIFLRRLLANKPLVIYGDGRQTRDFVHVRDVARANLVAGESAIRDGIYNVGTGVQSSLLQLLDILRKLQPALRVQFESERVGEVRHSVARLDAIRHQLAFDASIRLEEGVAAFYQWCRQAK